VGRGRTTGAGFVGEGRGPSLGKKPRGEPLTLSDALHFQSGRVNGCLDSVEMISHFPELALEIALGQILLPAVLEHRDDDPGHAAHKGYDAGEYEDVLEDIWIHVVPLNSAGDSEHLRSARPSVFRRPADRPNWNPGCNGNTLNALPAGKLLKLNSPLLPVRA